MRAATIQRMPTADNGRTERITIRCTIEQRELWERAASDQRRTLADWIRLQLDDLAANLAKNAEVRESPNSRRGSR